MSYVKTPDTGITGHTGKAIASVITAFLFLSLVSLLIKLQEKAGAKLEWILFMQFSSALLIITAIASKNKFRDLKTKKLKFHVIRGVTGMAAFTCLAVSMSEIPLVNAVLLNNTTPLFIPFITLLWLKIKIDEKIWYGILTGFAGIIFILKPSSHELLKAGDLYGLASGIILAVSYVDLKILTKTESFVTIIFYYSLIAFLISAPFAILSGADLPQEIWYYGTLTGVFFVSYLYLLQYSYRYIEPVKLSPFNYLVIVFTGIFDWIFFDSIPDIISVIGIVLVSAGGIIAITIHEKDNKELKHHWH